MNAITLPPALLVTPAHDIRRRPVKETNTMTHHLFAGFTLPPVLMSDAVRAGGMAS